jgi:hypothetical protein
MSVHLYPPLRIIRADFAASPVAAVPESEPDAVELSLAGGMDVPPDIPPAIADLIRRRVAADHAFGPEAPAVGQIRALLEVPNETGPGTRPVRRTFGILLGASLGGARWRGWLVAQEVDYATDRDLVIESEDGPCSPEAGMVQTWNEIGVTLDGSEPLLGRLSPQRLEAVVCLAGGVPTAENTVESRPGRVGAWDLKEGMAVVTGTPLGNASDPRREYQDIYRSLGQLFPIAARAKVPSAQQLGAAGWLERLAGILVRPAWAYAATALVVLQGAWIIGMSQQMPTEDGGREAVYRSEPLQGAAAVACQTTIHAVFNPDSSFAEIIILLRKIEASVVAGPSETGELWLALPKGRLLEEGVAMLKSSAVVQSAEISLPSRRECGK